MTLIDAIGKFAKKTVCSITSTNYDAYRLYRNVAAGKPLSSGPWANQVKTWMCNDPTPIPDLPPEKGKCDGVVYGFRIQLYNPDGTPGTILGAGFGNDPYTYWGPIGIAEAEPRVDGSGSNIYLYSRGDDNNPILPYDRYLFTATSSVLRAEVIELRRMDGQPDACGGPSPLPEPTPGWNQRSDNITYVNNEGSNVTIPVTAIVGYAKVNIDASISVPIKVNVGGINLNLDFNLSTGDINLFPSTNYYGDRRPGSKPIDILPEPDSDVSDYPPSLSPPPPPIDEDTEETERLIVGCVVTVTNINGRAISTLFQDDNPDIKIPNLGHVSFLCRYGFTQAAWTSDIPVKNIRNIIQCPWEPGAFKVAGTPQPGVTWVITPLYSLKESVPVFP